MDMSHLEVMKSDIIDKIGQVFSVLGEQVQELEV